MLLQCNPTCNSTLSRTINIRPTHIHRSDDLLNTNQCAASSNLCISHRPCASHCGSRMFDKTVFSSFQYEFISVYLLQLLSLLIGRGPAALSGILYLVGNSGTKEKNSDKPNREQNLPSNSMIIMCYYLQLLLSYSASRISTHSLNKSLAIFAVRPRLFSPPRVSQPARLSRTVQCT